MYTVKSIFDVQLAFLDQGRPSATQVGKKLARAGAGEAVCVPLQISDVFHAGPGVIEAVRQVQAAHPGAKVRASRPVGPEASLLNIVDRQLRASVRADRLTELDGLVLAASGSQDIRSNAVIARRARQWGTHHKLPCVVGLAGTSGSGVADAVRTLRAQGRRHIAVGSWFLSDGVTYAASAAAARAAGAVTVSAPIGSTTQVAELALSRYLVAAMELLEVNDEPAEQPVCHLSVVAG